MKESRFDDGGHGWCGPLSEYHWSHLPLEIGRFMEGEAESSKT